MKNCLFLTLCFLFAGIVGTKAQDEVNYLLDGKIKVSLMGGPITEFSSSDNKFTSGSGGFGALLFNNRIYVGGYGLSSTSERRWNNGSSPALRHGGFLLGGYLSNPKNLLHLGIQSQLGWGIARWEGSTGYLLEDDVFVVSPQAVLGCNVTKWFRLNLTGGYRMVTNVPNTSLNSPTFGLGFIFGWYSK